MIEFRSFRNDDVPHIVQIWRSEPESWGVYRSVSPMLLEQYVFSRLYFDPASFLVAVDAQGQRLGFAHVTFCPGECAFTWDFSTAVISMVMVRPGADEDTLALQLIREAIAYGKRRGARRVWAGSRWSWGDFYRGLYASTNAVGILQSDTRRSRWFEASGFVATDRCCIYQVRTGALRPVVTRQHVMYRRHFRLQTLLDPMPRSWWEAHLVANQDTSLFRLVPVDHGPPVAEILYCDMEPLATQWGVHAAEVEHARTLVEPAEPHWTRYLLAESIKQWSQSGTHVVQATVDFQDQAEREFLEQIGFQLIDIGVYRKLELEP